MMTLEEARAIVKKFYRTPLSAVPSDDKEQYHQACAVILENGGARAFSDYLEELFLGEHGGKK